HNAQPVWLAEGPEEEENKRAAENTAGSSDEIESEGSHSLDDALGLYLRQMGAIPLLNRQQELELAQRLDLARARYRHAALCSWKVLGLMVSTFERVRAGQMAIAPVIDVVTSVGLSRDEILARLPHTV